MAEPLTCVFYLAEGGAPYTAGTISYALPVCQAKSDCGGFAVWEWKTSYFLLVIYDSIA